MKEKSPDYVPQRLINMVPEELKAPDAFCEAVAPAIAWYIENCDPNQTIVISDGRVKIVDSNDTHMSLDCAFGDEEGKNESKDGEMDELKELRKLVCKLEKERDEEKQIKILQEISTKLLTKYEVRISDNEIVHPLRVEAYYYPCNDQEKFDDSCAHLSPKKMNNFGGLYFIEDRYGYPGIDICLSQGDYYLSFLIKNSYLNNYSPVDPGFKQMDLFERYKARWEELESRTDLLHKMALTVDERIFLTSRVGLSEEKTKFAHALLSSFIKIERKSKWLDFETGYGKARAVAQYLVDSKLEPTEETIKAILGERSNEVVTIYQELIMKEGK